MSFWPEFLLVASVHFVAVASPGPDFAIILRYAVRHGVKVALAASIGIGLGILVHVAYSLLGIGLLLKTTPWLFQLFSAVAAAYLAYIGVQALRSAPPSQQQDVTEFVAIVSRRIIDQWLKSESNVVFSGVVCGDYFARNAK
jgi:threonine/homoserine/homoserine lactone efflux protein